MYAPNIMIIDVEKALRSSGVWKMMKNGSRSADQSCTAYKGLYHPSA